MSSLRKGIQDKSLRVYFRKRESTVLRGDKQEIIVEEL